MRVKVSDWSKASITAGISALAILCTFLSQPKDPEYAGSVFSWGITHFLPLAFLSLATGIVAVVFYARSLARKESRSAISISLPIFLLLPLFYLLAKFVLLIARPR